MMIFIQNSVSIAHTSQANKMETMIHTLSQQTAIEQHVHCEWYKLKWTVRPPGNIMSVLCLPFFNSQHETINSTQFRIWQLHSSVFGHRQKKFNQVVVKQNYWLVFPETDKNDMMKAFNEEHSVQQM